MVPGQRAALGRLAGWSGGLALFAGLVMAGHARGATAGPLVCSSAVGRDVNVRAEPNTASDIVAVIASDATVPALEVNPSVGWAKVLAGDDIGWASLAMLRCVEVTLTPSPTATVVHTATPTPSPTPTVVTTSTATPPTPGRICVWMFEDTNGNALSDDGTSSTPAAFELDGQRAEGCEAASPGSHAVQVLLPDGFRPAISSSWRVSVISGRTVRLEIGLAPEPEGQAVLAAPPTEASVHGVPLVLVSLIVGLLAAGAGALLRRRRAARWRSWR